MISSYRVSGLSEGLSEAYLAVARRWSGQPSLVASGDRSIQLDSRTITDVGCDQWLDARSCMEFKGLGKQLTTLYDKAALPHDLPQLRRAFNLALIAGLQKAEEIPEPRRSWVVANLQQFMLDAAKPARLLLEIKDGVAREDRMPSAMANYIMVYSAYTRGGLRRAVQKFGIRSVLFTLKATPWSWLLKSRRADRLIGLIGQPSERMREFQVATIIGGFAQLKEAFYRSKITQEDRKRKLQHYKQVYPQGLRLLKTETMPEPLRSEARHVLEEITNNNLA
jgi:hypothetical protein